MLAQLFSSSARVKVLGLFLLNSAERFYQREIAKLLELPLRAVQRETARLVEIELLRRITSGNRVYFQIDSAHFLFPELKRIFLKTLGAHILLGDSLRSSLDVAIAFVYGSYAEDAEEAGSDIDLFVIGTVAARRLNAALADFRESTMREINAHVITVREFREALKRGDGFLQKVMASSKIFIVGCEEVLQQIAA